MTESFKSPDEIIRHVRTVSSLPAVFERVNEVANHPHASLGDVAAVISEDVGLSARLLRLVNSAFYGFPSRIESITHACIIVGTHQIRQLAMATSVMEVFRDLDPNDLDMDAFWRHSIGCAMIARGLAVRLGEADIERFFIAGLLHDIGRLVLLQVAPEKTAELLKAGRSSDSQSLLQLENTHLGFTHGELGGALLTAWNLPPSLVNPVRYHHVPSRSGIFPREAAITHWSDIIVHAMDFGDSGAPYFSNGDSQSWDALGLEVEVLHAVTEDVRTQLDDVVSFFYGDEA